MTRGEFIKSAGAAAVVAAAGRSFGDDKPVAIPDIYVALQAEG